MWWPAFNAGALGIPTEGGNVKLNVAIQNLLQLLRQLRAVLEPLIFRKLPQIEISSSARVVPRATGFEESENGTLRRVPIQWILGFGGSGRGRRRFWQRLSASC